MRLKKDFFGDISWFIFNSSVVLLSICVKSRHKLRTKFLFLIWNHSFIPMGPITLSVLFEGNESPKQSKCNVCSCSSTILQTASDTFLCFSKKVDVDKFLKSYPAWFPSFVFFADSILCYWIGLWILFMSFLSSLYSKCFSSSNSVKCFSKLVFFSINLIKVTFYKKISIRPSIVLDEHFGSKLKSFLWCSKPIFYD